MARKQPDHPTAGRLLRYLAIPAGCGALALTLAAAAPAAAAPAGGALTQVATIPVGQNPTGVAVDPATNTVYVTCTGPSPDLYAINGATNTVAATIPVGSNPRAVAVNQATDTVYTASQTAGTISVIDGATNIVTATIPVAGAYLVAADASGNTVYAAGSGGLSIIDGATNTVTATASLPSGVVAIAVNPASNKLYVAFSDEVEVLQGSNGKLLTTVSFPYEVRNVIADPSDNVIYVAWGRYDYHVLEGISGKTSARVGRIRLRDATGWQGGSPVGLAVDQSTHRVFVTDRYYLIQVNGKTFRGPVTVTVNAVPVAADPTTSMVYVARYGSPNVYAYHTTVG